MARTAPTSCCKVPVGTQIYEEDGETLLADLEKAGDSVVLAKGGNGGFGNARFKTSTNRAPRNANPGQPGEERTIRLRMKLIADAGVVGLPNAGKSTFLAAVSAARPKIADYPFTTLHPQLGVVEIDDQSFVLADIPGLIEGAHEGAGLGDRFLGHIERCRVLLHLVDGTGEHAGEAYKTVRAELDAYGEGLADKPEIVALNKADALTPEELKQQVARLKRASQEDAAGDFGRDPAGRARGAAGAAEGDRRAVVGPAPARQGRSRPGSRRRACRKPPARMLKNAPMRQWPPRCRLTHVRRHQVPRPRRLPPHRREGRLLAPGRFQGRPGEGGLAGVARRRHRAPAQEQARRAGGLLGRDRARPRRAQAAEGAAQARGFSRAPRRSARSRSRAPGRRRCRATASPPARCW